MSWTGTDADGSLTTTPALLVVTYIDAQDEVWNTSYNVFFSFYIDTLFQFRVSRSLITSINLPSGIFHIDFKLILNFEVKTVTNSLLLRT